jgi:hypothetical protein
MRQYQLICNDFMGASGIQPMVLPSNGPESPYGGYVDNAKGPLPQRDVDGDNSGSNKQGDV